MRKKLVAGLTGEETNRLRKYTDLISASDGNIDVLTDEERRDMKQLIKETEFVRTLLPEDELKVL